MNNSYLYFQTFLVLGKEIMWSQNMFSLGTEKKEKEKKKMRNCPRINWTIRLCLEIRQNPKDIMSHHLGEMLGPGVRYSGSGFNSGANKLAYLNPTCCKASE